MGQALADIVGAIVDVLKANGGIAALAGEHVHGGELPSDLTPLMPRHALLVQPSGGVAFAPASKADLAGQRLDVTAFGPTPKDADDLRGLASKALFAVERQVHAGVLIHWVQSAGGTMAGRDRDTAWPFAFQSVQTLFATDEVP